jgi:hypothetical protein
MEMLQMIRVLYVVERRAKKLSTEKPLTLLTITECMSSSNQVMPSKLLRRQRNLWQRNGDQSPKRKQGRRYSVVIDYVYQTHRRPNAM